MWWLTREHNLIYMHVNMFNMCVYECVCVCVGHIHALVCDVPPMEQSKVCVSPRWCVSARKQTL